MKKLFLVHCGFYDLELSDGIFESHVNFFVTGTDFEDARNHAKLIPEFKAKKMHVDGLQEVSAVMGHRILVEHDPTLNNQTIVVSSRHRDLASKQNTIPTS